MYYNIFFSVLGQEVLGIWPKDSSKADVNCSHLAHMGGALATGDDSGFVKLFEFPCEDKYVSLNTASLVLESAQPSSTALFMDIYCQRIVIACGCFLANENVCYISDLN